MLHSFSRRMAAFAQRFVPDPFVIAMVLTAIALALGWAAMEEPDLGALAEGWFSRVAHPGTLTFTYQMALMLIAGTTLAKAPPVRALLGRLADVPRTSAQAAALTAFVAMLTALLNWGFGLVAGAVLAREIGDRARAAGRPLHYPLVCASGYTGLMVWHGGFSGSAPLKVAGGGPPVGEPIGLDLTVLSPLNLAISAALLAWVPFLVSRLAREPAPAVDVAPRAHEPPVERVDPPGVLLTALFVALGGLALASIVGRVGWMRGLGIDTVNLVLVVAGLALFATPQRYARAFVGSVGEAGGILLQFPFYFGILGLLEAGGLIEDLARGAADAAATLAGWGLPLAWSFDVTTFASAGLVNLFVPSGGGQWAVQGTILVEAAGELGLPVSRAVMALAYGDEWTNMLQPFWALALLGITGLRARDILGYTLTVMLLALPVYLVGFALL